MRRLRCTPGGPPPVRAQPPAHPHPAPLYVAARRGGTRCTRADRRLHGRVRGNRVDDETQAFWVARLTADRARFFCPHHLQTVTPSHGPGFNRGPSQVSQGSTAQTMQRIPHGCMREGGGGRCTEKVLDAAVRVRAASSRASLSIPMCRCLRRPCSSSTVSALGFTDACPPPPRRPSEPGRAGPGGLERREGVGWGRRGQGGKESKGARAGPGGPSRGRRRPRPARCAPREGRRRPPGT